MEVLSWKGARFFTSLRCAQNDMWGCGALGMKCWEGCAHDEIGLRKDGSPHSRGHGRGLSVEWGRVEWGRDSSTSLRYAQNDIWVEGEGFVGAERAIFIVNGFGSNERAVREPPLRIAAYLVLNAIGAVYFHSNEIWGPGIYIQRGGLDSAIDVDEAGEHGPGGEEGYETHG